MSEKDNPKSKGGTSQDSDHNQSRRDFLKGKVWGWGLLLGSVNFGSIYFLVRALHYTSPAGKNMDSSVIFGANNISIVALSVLIGLLVFRERLKLVNWIGVMLSALALLLFTLV